MNESYKKGMVTYINALLKSGDFLQTILTKSNGDCLDRALDNYAFIESVIEVIKETDVEDPDSWINVMEITKESLEKQLTEILKRNTIVPCNEARTEVAGTSTRTLRRSRRTLADALDETELTPIG